MDEMRNDDYLEQYAGQGTEDLVGGTPWLDIANKVSEEADAKGKKLGQFWHSGLNLCLGKTVRVIPLAWKNVWAEKDQGGRSVGYHAPNTIDLQETGAGESYSCVNEETGNIVVKTFVIPLVLPDHENSFCMFVPNRSSVVSAKKWRADLNINRLSSGAKAPIFSHVWELQIGKGSKKGNSFFFLEGVKKLEQVSKEYLLADVIPLQQLIAGDPVKLLPIFGSPTIKQAEEESPF